MGWTAEVIYLPFSDYILQELQNIEFFKNSIYHITDLNEASDYYKKNLKDLPEYKIELPPEGILTINPNIKHPARRKPSWDYYDFNYAPLDLPELIQKNTSEKEQKLFTFIQRLSNKIKKAVFYYYCETWSGIDYELSIIFDSSCLSVYYYSLELENTIEILTDNTTIPISESGLEKGLKAVGINIHSWYFPLHERDFNWEKHRIH